MSTGVNVHAPTHANRVITITYPPPALPSSPTSQHTLSGHFSSSPTPTSNAYEDFNFNTSTDPNEEGYKKFWKGGRVSVTAVGGMRSGNGGQLRRQLKERHIQFIAIGGCIGIGLFLGTAESLTWGGPAGLLLGYALMGSIVYCIMISLGEMISHLPLPGGHITLADRFVDSAFSFTMGWNYWYNWTIVLPAELNASAVLFSYWNNSINPAAWIALCLTVTVAINLGGSRTYGETEFIFTSLKIIVHRFLVLRFDTNLAGTCSPDYCWLDNSGCHFGCWRRTKSQGDWWKKLDLGWRAIPRVPRQRLFWKVLRILGCSYPSCVLLHRSRNHCHCWRGGKESWQISYVLGVFVIGLLVDSNDPRLNLNSGTAASSPFVIAINDAGIKVLPSIVNAALLSSAWSAASSDLYTSSRALYGLAINGNAPAVCTRVSSWGLPWVAVLVGVSFSFLSFMSAGSVNAGIVFGWFSSMSSCAGMINWAGIAWTYIRFYNGAAMQEIHRELFPYHGRFQPYAAWYALIGCCIILIFNGFRSFVPGNWDTSQFITSYLPLFLFPVMYGAARWWKGSEVVPYIEMDYFSGSRDTTVDEYEIPAKANWTEKLWAWIV